MENSPTPVEKPSGSAADRRSLGRRKSDWLMPILLWIVALCSVLAARHFYLRAMEAEAMNAVLKQQVQLLERGKK
jgi:hypothetical protein